ncbi:hypothetical protein PRZ48_010293 [Zasmidium cellare]|uniref:C3H1-type domain-containing protein n=1 Tax=Zasmidium cellare TaxID=395010 RepID=A0ABR0E8D8_ZASCE|nr:hypothetical protein PRZ48_010293 [Zasmidium cellare]
MAAYQVDADSELQAKIQAAVQPKLVENGWVDEENDNTLSEYVTMMIVNGKDLKGVQAELGGDLLGVGEDDPGVGAFAQWLFETVRQLAAPQQQQQQSGQSGAQEQNQQQTQPIPTVQDAQMEDSAAPADAPYVNTSHFNNPNFNGLGQQASYMHFPQNPFFSGFPPQMMGHPFAYQQMQHFNQLTQMPNSPTGPRSMRNGNTQGRGRGGRMLGQMNRSMDRSTDLPDNLRRIKGASGVSAGRINSHSGRDGPPRGPRGSGVANGIQRMMNGGRGGHQNNMGGMANPMMGGGPTTPQQQMQFMQMMEMQTNMMAQLIANGQMPNANGNFQNQRGGRGGARGGRGGNKQLHAVNGKMPDGALPGSNTNAGGSGMDIDGEGTDHGDKFSTLCRFNLTCTNPTCGFAHQSPAAPPNAPVDLSDTCAHGAACTNHKCSARHPSPAQRGQGQNGKQEVDCRFYPNCTAGANCPFRHPTEKPCKFGGDCTNANCKFAHPKIMCRYNPCLNPSCMFKHADGQKRGKFEDKVWTSNGGEEGGKADRFAGFAKQTENGEEELVLPGQQQQAEQSGQEQQNGGGDAMEQTQQPEGSSSSQQMETQIVV